LARRPIPVTAANAPNKADATEVDAPVFGKACFGLLEAD